MQRIILLGILLNLLLLALNFWAISKLLTNEFNNLKNPLAFGFGVSGNVVNQKGKNLAHIPEVSCEVGMFVIRPPVEPGSESLFGSLFGVSVLTEGTIIRRFGGYLYSWWDGVVECDYVVPVGFWSEFFHFDFTTTPREEGFGFRSQCENTARYFFVPVPSPNNPDSQVEWNRVKDSGQYLSGPLRQCLMTTKPTEGILVATKPTEEVLRQDRNILKSSYESYS